MLETRLRHVLSAPCRLGDRLVHRRWRTLDMTRWQLAHGRQLDLGAKAVLMGILNVTPDSFSDGGEFDEPDRAVAHAAAHGGRRRGDHRRRRRIDPARRRPRSGARGAVTDPSGHRSARGRWQAPHFGRHLSGRDGAAGGCGRGAYRQRRPRPAARARHRAGGGRNRRRACHHAHRARPRKAPRRDRRPVPLPRKIAGDRAAGRRRR